MWRVVYPILNHHSHWLPVRYVISLEQAPLSLWVFGASEGELSMVLSAQTQQGAFLHRGYQK